MQASVSGVQPVFSDWLIIDLAPFSSKSLTILMYPNSAAMCKGVFPSSERRNQQYHLNSKQAQLLKCQIYSSLIEMLCYWWLTSCAVYVCFVSEKYLHNIDRFLWNSNMHRISEHKEQQWTLIMWSVSGTFPIFKIPVVNQVHTTVGFSRQYKNW